MTGVGAGERWEMSTGGGHAPLFETMSVLGVPVMTKKVNIIIIIVPRSDSRCKNKRFTSGCEAELYIHRDVIRRGVTTPSFDLDSCF